MFEESNGGLEISIKNICEIIVIVIVIVYAKGINRGITKKTNCCCLHQVVNRGTQNSANNNEF